MSLGIPSRGFAAAVAGGLFASLMATSAGAVNVNFVSGATGIDQAVMQELFKAWEEETGNTVTIVPMPSSTTDQFAQYKLWLAAQNPDIDVYMVDVIWAPQLAEQFVDLTEALRRRERRPLPLDRRVARPSTASSSRCRSSPTRRRSTIARTCWRSTAPRCRPPGRS